jgi:hypothetical protein
VSCLQNLTQGFGLPALLTASHSFALHNVPTRYTGGEQQIACQKSSAIHQHADNEPLAVNRQLSDNPPTAGDELMPESRTLAKPKDVFTIKNPCEDVQTLFEHKLALASTEEDRKNIEAILQQASETPPGPRSYPDPPAISTSTGHVIRYTHPPKVGVSWGDFDAAEKWQAAGLQITKGLIPNKTRKKKLPNSRTFVEEDDTN